jgi:hypothetical protein
VARASPPREVRGVTIKAFLVDEFGREHVTISHTTIPQSAWMHQPEKIRAAIEEFYLQIGLQLVSLQAQVEADPVIITEAAANGPGTCA